MKQRIIFAGGGAILLAIALLFLPPGLTYRLASLSRYLVEPSQSWANLATRVSKAVIGDDSPVLTQEKYEELRNELAYTQVALNTTWSQYASARNENKFLKSRLRLVYNDEFFTLTVCKVIKRDLLSSFYDTLIINRGFKDGLKVGQIVLTFPPEPQDNEKREQPALLGLVREVAADTAQVTLATASDFSIACRIPERYVTGLLIGRESSSQEGPQILLPPGSLLMDSPTGTQFDTIQVGDQVFTSSLDENPESIEDIYIGTVQQLSLTENGAPVIHIKPAVDNSQLAYVLVALKAHSKP